MGAPDVRLSSAEIREFLASLSPEAKTALLEAAKHENDPEPYHGTVPLNGRAVRKLKSISRRPRHLRLVVSNTKVRGPRRRGAGRPAARRATVATRGSPDDPEPALRRDANYTFACSSCPHCGATLRIYLEGIYCPTASCPWGRA